VRVFRHSPAVLFDALLDNAMWNGEHRINKVGEAGVFNVCTLGILGGRFRVTRQNSLLESECRRGVRMVSTIPQGNHQAMDEYSVWRNLSGSGILNLVGTRQSEESATDRSIRSCYVCSGILRLARLTT
jgi:hypothetical protein